MLFLDDSACVCSWSVPLLGRRGQSQSVSNQLSFRFPFASLCVRPFPMACCFAVLHRRRAGQLWFPAKESECSTWFNIQKEKKKRKSQLYVEAVLHILWFSKPKHVNRYIFFSAMQIKTKHWGVWMLSPHKYLLWTNQNEKQDGYHLVFMFSWVYFGKTFWKVWISFLPGQKEVTRFKVLGTKDSEGWTPHIIFKSSVYLLGSVWNSFSFWMRNVEHEIHTSVLQASCTAKQKPAPNVFRWPLWCILTQGKILEGWWWKDCLASGQNHTKWPLVFVSTSVILKCLYNPVCKGIFQYFKGKWFSLLFDLGTLESVANSAFTATWSDWSESLRERNTKSIFHISEMQLKKMLERGRKNLLSSKQT